MYHPQRRLTARRKQIARRRRGANTVEFAFVFPIVLTFFFGLISLSRALQLRDTAQHAAFEGARAGLVLNATEVDCREAVENFTDSMGLSGVTTVIEPASLTNEDEVVSVRVVIPLRANAWVSGSFVPDDATLESEVTLTRRSD